MENGNFWVNFSYFYVPPCYRILKVGHFSSEYKREGWEMFLYCSRISKYYMMSHYDLLFSIKLYIKPYISLVNLYCIVHVVSDKYSSNNKILFIFVRCSSWCSSITFFFLLRHHPHKVIMNRFFLYSLNRIQEWIFVLIIILFGVIWRIN